MGEFEALLVQAVEDFEADAGAAVGADLLPAGHGGFASCDQGFDVTDRVLHIEVDAVGRLFAAVPAALAGLVKHELLAEMGLESLLAVVGGGFAIDLGAGHFIVGRPVAAGGDGIQGAVQRGAVLVEQRMGHRFLLCLGLCVAGLRP